MSAASLETRQRCAAWWLLAPGLAVALALGLFPLLQTFFLSATDAMRGEDSYRVTGFANYAALFARGDFREALGNTLLFAAVSVSLELALGLGIALFLDAEFRGRGALRAIMLAPWALPTVVAARVWSWMLNDVFGVANDLLVHRLGVLSEPVAWTATPGLAMAVLVAADVWKTTPFMVLLLLAGLQTIPRELHEAAAVDGAGPVRRLASITLPLLAPAIAVAVVFRTLDALRVFDMIWVMTAGRFGTETVGTFAYRQLVSYDRLGLGSAAATVLFLVVAVFAAGASRALREPRG